MKKQNELCANCGHPRVAHEGRRCEGAGGCGHNCPCRKFVAWQPVTK